MANVGGYEHNFQLGRARAEAHKVLRSKNVGLLGCISIPNQDKTGIYSGRFNINMQEKEIEILYYKTSEAKASAAIPDKIKIFGLEYSVKYTAMEREKIANPYEIRMMYENARSRARKGI